MANNRSKNSSEFNSVTAKQSTLNAGQDLSIVATGAAVGTQGDIQITGSSLKAANTLLLAKNDVLMQSAQNTTDRKNEGSKNKTAIGASFNIGEQNGFTLDLGAQGAKNNGNGNSVTQVNSTLDTGSLLLQSGGDTTLKGAQVRADRIKADIGGNLNIISLQDTESSRSKQSSAGFGASICVPPFCYGSTVAGSANLAAANMNSDYKGVTDQSGLYAGTGGYDINVGKTTTLQGAVIASEASADKNRLSTDRLIVSDIKNVSEIKSQSAGISVSSSSTSGASMGGSIPIALKEKDHSYTRSAVSEGTIVVRSAEGANDLVGLNRDTANANQKLDRPDEKAMQERIDLIQSSAQLASGVISAVGKAKADEAKALADKAKTQTETGSPDAAGTVLAANAAYTEAQRWQVGGDKRLMADIASGLVAAGLGGAPVGATVGIVANTASSDIFNKIGDYAQSRATDPKSDAATRAAWAEGGAARVMLHALAGAAIGLSSGNVQSGALGAGASAALMPSIADALGKNGIKGVDQDAMAALIAAGAGAVVGSGSGTSGAVVAGGNAMSVDVYNRAAHETEMAAIKAEAQKGDFTEANLRKALCYVIQCWAQLDRGTQEYHDAVLTEADMVGLSNELAWADAQKDKGLFNYSFTDSVKDWGTRDVIPLAGSATSLVSGGISVGSGGVLCATAAGCVFGAPMMTFGAGNMWEGGSGVWNHYTGLNDNSNPVRAAFDLIPGGYGPTVYSGADLAFSVGAGFVKVPLKLGLADGLNRSKSMFGVTVRKFDNNQFYFWTGKPIRYGSAAAVYLKSVGEKGYTFYEEASRDKN
ncbi:hemagglutinin repeat-containing protein [Pseudomonas sp. R4-39-08]|uniref:hemagglutinin repeat-containing protein n=1 Tax=Pseudomonas sp. R4-39-08 TaxID=1173288 RepID=UPI0021150169|nr:hemagglutinin repeat-containing protein [Pseudomonas sp. R4-39-08]